MSSLLTIVHVAVSVLLVLVILLQHRASGLSATFGGTGGAYVQRRGAERVLYVAGIWLGIAFFGLSVLQWYVL